MGSESTPTTGVGHAALCGGDDGCDSIKIVFHFLIEFTIGTDANASPFCKALLRFIGFLGASCCNHQHKFNKKVRVELPPSKFYQFDVGRPLLSDEMLLSKEAVELRIKLLSEERVRSC